MANEPTTSFTVALNARTRDEIEAIQDRLGTKTKAETLRRMSHVFLKILDVDPTRPDSLVVVGKDGRRQEIVF